jgi:hypothetical protein
VKKLINSPETMLGESLAGFAAAHSDLVMLDPELRFVRRRNVRPGKVALVSGGASDRHFEEIWRRCEDNSESAWIILMTWTSAALNIGRASMRDSIEKNAKGDAQ